MIYPANLSWAARCVAVCVLTAWGVAAVAPGEEREVAPAEVSSSSARAEWRKKLDEWYAGMKRAGMGMDMPQLAEIDDPAAVQPVIAMLNREKSYSLKRRCLEALGKIGRNPSLKRDSSEARELLAALVKASLEPNPIQGVDPIREEAIKQIAQLPNKRDAIPLYTKFLSTRHVSRAAEALLAIDALPPLLKYEKPDPKLTIALVNALVQKEKKRVTAWVDWEWTTPMITRGGSGTKWEYVGGFITRLVLNQATARGGFPVPRVVARGRAGAGGAAASTGVRSSCRWGMRRVPWG